MPRKFQQGKLLVEDRVENPYWYIKCTVPVMTTEGLKKQRVNKILGLVRNMTKRQAEQARAEVLAAVNQPHLVALAQVKFSELVAQYMKTEWPLLGAGARGRYQSVIDNHLLPAFGAMRLCDIKPALVQEFLASNVDKYSWWTRQSMKGILSALFSAARRWGVTSNNPTEGVRIGKKVLVREKRLITSQQLRAILGGLQDRERFITTILYALGLRISECLGLEWRDVDLERRTLTIRRRWYRGDLQEEAKTEAGNRVLALGPLVEEFRRRYPGPQARFIFADPVTGMPPDDRDLLRWNFRPVVAGLGLYYQGFGWHAFRRANVTGRQTIAGATPLEAMRAAGHSNVDMTLLYTLGDQAREGEQVGKLLDELWGISMEGPKM
jgi:integrase